MYRLLTIIAQGDPYAAMQGEVDKLKNFVHYGALALMATGFTVAVACIAGSAINERWRSRGFMGILGVAIAAGLLGVGGAFIPTGG